MKKRKKCAIKTTLRTRHQSESPADNSSHSLPRTLAGAQIINHALTHAIYSSLSLSLLTPSKHTQAEPKPPAAGVRSLLSSALKTQNCFLLPLSHPPPIYPRALAFEIREREKQQNASRKSRHVTVYTAERGRGKAHVECVPHARTHAQNTRVLLIGGLSEQPARVSLYTHTRESARGCQPQSR